MKNLEQKMIDKINNQIKITMSFFTEWNPSHEFKRKLKQLKIQMSY